MMIVVTLLFLFGLVIGSFLGALTYRLPRNMSISRGRSICPNCKKQIKWFDNIPLVSYLLLVGKCRNCGKIISLRYPLIELATAVTFVLVGVNIFNLIIASLLIAIFVIDIEHQLIPDELVFWGIAVLLLKFIIYNSHFLFPNILAGFLSALFLLLLHLVTRGKGMGLGDVKLAIFLGAIVGINKFLVWFFFSFLTGAIVGIILIMLGNKTLKQRIAFGPFLIIGLILTNYFGPAFLKLIIP